MRLKKLLSRVSNKKTALPRKYEILTIEDVLVLHWRVILPDDRITCKGQSPDDRITCKGPDERKKIERNKTKTVRGLC